MMSRGKLDMMNIVLMVPKGGGNRWPFLDTGNGLHTGRWIGITIGTPLRYSCPKLDSGLFPILP